MYPLPIIVNKQPLASFTASATEGCMPASILFNNTSSGLFNPVYNWNFGNGDSSSISNPTVIYKNAGSFGVKLLVTNSGGCKDELVLPGMINIYDPAPPPPVKLNSISVEDTNMIKVSWNKINLDDINNYIIYRLETANGLYDSIGVVNQDNNVANQVLSFMDNQVNTSLHPFTY